MSAREKKEDKKGCEGEDTSLKLEHKHCNMISRRGFERLSETRNEVVAFLYYIMLSGGGMRLSRQRMSFPLLYLIIWNWKNHILRQ